MRPSGLPATIREGGSTGKALGAFGGLGEEGQGGGSLAASDAHLPQEEEEESESSPPKERHPTKHQMEGAEDAAPGLTRVFTTGRTKTLPTSQTPRSEGDPRMP